MKKYIYKISPNLRCGIHNDLQKMQKYDMIYELMMENYG